MLKKIKFYTIKKIFKNNITYYLFIYLFNTYAYNHVYIYVNFFS